MCLVICVKIDPLQESATAISQTEPGPPKWFVV